MGGQDAGSVPMKTGRGIPSRVGALIVLLMVTGCSLIRPAPEKVCAPAARMECPDVQIVLPSGPIAADVAAGVWAVEREARVACATRHRKLIECTQ